MLQVGVRKNLRNFVRMLKLFSHEAVAVTVAMIQHCIINMFHGEFLYAYAYVYTRETLPSFFFIRNSVCLSHDLQECFQPCFAPIRGVSCRFNVFQHIAQLGG